MTSLNRLRDRYFASLEANDSQKSNIELIEARDALIEGSLPTLTGREENREFVALLTEIFQELQRRANATPDNPELLFELGIFSTLVRIATAVALPPRRDVSRSQDYLDVLRILGNEGPLNKTALAKALYGDGVTGASAQSMMSRLTKQMLRVGLTIETQRGRERVVAPTEQGKGLLATATRNKTGPASSIRGPILTVPRIELKDAALPNSIEDELKPTDRTRFHLLVSGLCVARHISEKKTWLDCDSYFAQLLKRFPLGATPDLHDDESLLAVNNLWPERDRNRYRLMEVLFQFQVEDRRQGLVKELMQVGNKLEKGSIYALLWAPCAINVALRAGAGGVSRQADYLLARTEDLLGSMKKNPLALHIRGMGAKLRNDNQGCREIWGQVPQQGWDFTNESPTIFERRLEELYPQLAFGGNFNPVLEDFEGELRRFVRRTLRDMREVKSFLRERGGESWAQDLARWTVENREELADRIETSIEREEPQGLFVAARKMIETTSQAPEKPGQYTSDFLALVRRHRKQAEWILGLISQSDNPDVASAKPEEVAKWYERATLNNAWGPGLVWTDACLPTPVLMASERNPIEPTRTMTDTKNERT